MGVVVCGGGLKRRLDHECHGRVCGVCGWGLDGLSRPIVSCRGVLCGVWGWGLEDDSTACPTMSDMRRLQPASHIYAPPAASFLPSFLWAQTRGTQTEGRTYTPCFQPVATEIDTWDREGRTCRAMARPWACTALSSVHIWRLGL